MKITHSFRSLFALAVLALATFNALSAQTLSRDDAAELKTLYGITSTPYQETDVPPPSAGKVNACASSFIMNTPYNSNNGQRGCMFDIVATNSVTIRCFEANLYAGTTANYEIYYRPGTHVGFESNPAAWTLLGGATSVTSAGNNLPTPLPIPINVTIPAGQRYAFYITNDFGAGTSYTDGTAVGNFLAADANLTVYEGVGKSYPFGLTFNVRNFNGTIFYDLGTVLDANNLVLNASSTASSVALNWRKPQDTDPLAYHLYRSREGGEYELIHEERAGEVAYSVHDHAVDPGTSYFYRLDMIDADGQKVGSNTVEATLEKPETRHIGEVFPNPFADQAAVKLAVQESGPVELRVRNGVGQVVWTQQQELEAGETEMELETERLNSGVYFLEILSGQGREVHKLIKN